MASKYLSFEPSLESDTELVSVSDLAQFYEECHFSDFQNLGEKDGEDIQWCTSRFNTSFLTNSENCRFTMSDTVPSDFCLLLLMGINSHCFKLIAENIVPETLVRMIRGA